MEIPLVKLKAILLYLAENTDPKFFGKVKLMKLLYFIDFNHVKRYGLPITGDNYINMEHGPVPSVIKNLIYSVATEPDEALLADTIGFEHKPGNKIHRIVPVRKFSQKDKDLFSDSEIEILENVSKRFYSANKETIETAAHKEGPWSTTDELDYIPYWLAALDADSRFTQEEIKFNLSL